VVAFASVTLHSVGVQICSNSCQHFACRYVPFPGACIQPLEYHITHSPRQQVHAAWTEEGWTLSVSHCPLVTRG
jgi:hypothetical protein